MGRRRSQGRAVHGIVLLDKAAGQTSNRALQRVKRLFQAAKAGHTGSLDPFATGMLPICLGSATKVSAFLLEAAKEYRVRMVFGTSTDTADIDGRIVEERAVPAIAPEKVAAALADFVGESSQIPPMYSALKQAGRRLYELARAGVEVERKPRTIRIDWIRLHGCEWPEIEFTVRCSKGTYIRSLAVDVAASLGTIGHVVALRRLTVDPFDAGGLVSEEQLEAAAEEGPEALDRFLLGADQALPQFPTVSVDAAMQHDLVHGRPVAGFVSAGDGDLVRVYGPRGDFIGLAAPEPDGRLHPRRIFIA